MKQLVPSIKLAWNEGFEEYFASRRLPSPSIKNFARRGGCGSHDTTSPLELLMADKLGFSGKGIIFSSNNTPADEFVYARGVGQLMILDAYEDIAFLKSATSIPKVISCRYKSGGVLNWGTDIMDNPEEAKLE